MLNSPASLPAVPRRKALQLGLAGAATLACPVLLRQARASSAPVFSLGVASGQPQPQTLVLWTRLMGAALPPEVPVKWELADDEAFTRVVARGSETALAADAHSVHAEPAGLQPGRVYWYRFTALGQRSASGRTRTAPAPDHRVDSLRFVIASCQRYDVGHFAAWRDLAADAPDVVLFLGDYIYEYASSASSVRAVVGGRVQTLEDFRQRYAQAKSDPALQAAHAACPWYVIWDDHEVENDYAGWQGQRTQVGFAQRRSDAYQAWWEHLPLPKALRPLKGQARIYGHFDWGSLARLHLVDDRQFRDPQACLRPGGGGAHTVLARECAALFDPARSLLGAEQEAWLAQAWDTQRPWNLLAQQTLFSRLNWDGGNSADSMADGKGGGRYWNDGWDGYPAARQRLLDGVAQRRLGGLVVLGGDVHANFVANVLADFDKPGSAVLASEFCGTSITSLGSSQARLDQALPHNPHLLHGRADQRGYMRFELRSSQLLAELRVVADATDPDSRVSTAARFAVEAGRPGVQRR